MRRLGRKVALKCRGVGGPPQKAAPTGGRDDCCWRRHQGRQVMPPVVRGRDGAGLAGPERRTWRNGTRAHMMTRRKRRRNVTKGFTAGGALFRADQIGAEPVTLCFTTRIDTLNSRARHKGHKAFPPAAVRSQGRSEHPETAKDSRAKRTKGV